MTVRIALATTVLPGLDHIGPLERHQTRITVVRRAEDLAELLAIARSGLVDAVLVAGATEAVTGAFLEELARLPRPVGAAAISEVRAERRRLRALGVPCVRADAGPEPLAAAVVEAALAAAEGRRARADAVAEDEDGEDPVEGLDEIELTYGVLDDDPRLGPPLLGGDPERSAASAARPEAGAGDEAVDDGRRGGRAGDDLVPADAAQGGVTRDGVVQDRAQDGSAPGSARDDAQDSAAWDADAAGRSVPDVDRPDPRDPNGDAADHAEDRPDVEASGTPGDARVIAVWGPTGAPGRTTVAVNLAAEHAVAGRSTLLVDLDTYGPSVGAHLGLTEESAGVARAVRRADHGPLGPADLEAAGVRVRVAGAELTVLTGLTRVDRWPELRPAALTSLLAAARERWERVVVDVGFGLEQDEELSFDVPAPQRNGATLAALAAADEVLAVGGPDAVSLPRLVRGTEELVEAAPEARLRVVVNRLRPAAAGVSPRSQVEAVWSRYASADIPLAAFLPWDPAAADRALLGGQVLAEAAPNSALRRALAELADVDPRGARRTGRRRRPTGQGPAGAARRHPQDEGAARPSRRRTLMPWSARSRRTP